MSPFWAGLFDHLKDCGRNSTAFLGGLAGLFGVLVIGTIVSKFVHEEGSQPFIIVFGAGIALWMATWSIATLRRAFGRRRDRLRHPPLSCDELRVARSKLLKNRSRESI
jgi:hypothetical protein